jgi:spore maturation protein CgeB
MRVLYYIPHTITVGADHWIYRGWKCAFEDLGHRFYELTAMDDWDEKLLSVRPDLLFIPNFINLPKRRETLRRARMDGVRVFLVVDWPMREEEVRVIKEENIADVYFGEREPESMVGFESATGRQYCLIPNAANRLVHYPTAASPKYDYDLVYLGAYLPKKKKMIEEILYPLRKKYRVGIFGSCWTLKDNVLRAWQKVCRKAGLMKIANWINVLRVSVPENEENLLYSSARISVNFHEREADGSQPHYILNQRTFHIPACGGFEICDDVPALKKYFREDEVVIGKDPDDWFEKVEYYLKHEKERKAIQHKGTARALKDHMYHNRVETVIKSARDLRVQ